MEISYAAKEGGSRSLRLAGFWQADNAHAERPRAGRQRWLPSAPRRAAAEEPLPERSDTAGCSRWSEELPERAHPTPATRAGALREVSAGFYVLLIPKREAIHCLKGFLLHGCDIP